MHSIDVFKITLVSYVLWKLPAQCYDKEPSIKAHHLLRSNHHPRQYDNKCDRFSYDLELYGSDIHASRSGISDIGYCAGVCTVKTMNLVNTTSNAFYRGAFRERDPNLNYKAPCCVPIQYKPVTLMVQPVESNLECNRTYYDLIVLTCGCR